MLASKDGRSFETVDETDAGGAVVFCGVPADLPLIVTEPGSGKIAELTLRRGSGGWSSDPPQDDTDAQSAER